MRVGLAGNQPEAAEGALAALGLPVDFIASSAGWGVEKPSLEFFARTAEAAAVPPGEIAYVGDRLDNDVLPAAAFGMKAVFLRRGPWGLAHDGDPRLDAASLRVGNLSNLALLLQDL